MYAPAVGCSIGDWHWCQSVPLLDVHFYLTTLTSLSVPCHTAGVLLRIKYFYRHFSTLAKSQVNNRSIFQSYQQPWSASQKKFACRKTTPRQTLSPSALTTSSESRRPSSSDTFMDLKWQTFSILVFWYLSIYNWGKTWLFRWCQTTQFMLMMSSSAEKGDLTFSLAA